MPEIDRHRIQEAIESNEASVDDAEILEAAKRPAVLGIDPQETYAMACFLRHERRQDWVRLIVESRLLKQGSDFAAKGAFALDESEEQDGAVPGEPGWKYYFHGRGCCLTHEDGTIIDVDFADDGSAREIDRYFYNNYLASRPAPDWCEAKLAQPKCMRDAWHFDLERLKSFGFLTIDWRFSITAAGREFAEGVEPLVDAIDSPADASRLRTLLLCLAGDLESAAQQSGQVSLELSQQLAVLAESTVRQRAERIVDSMRTSADKSANHLKALAALGREHSIEILRDRLLRCPANGANHSAFDVLVHWNMEGAGTDEARLFGEALRRHTRVPLLKRVAGFVRKNEDLDDRPRKSLVVNLCRELLRSKDALEESSFDPRSLARTLRSDWVACDAEAGFLLYLLEPVDGLKKLGRALDSPIPITVAEAAAYLAVIGSDSSIDVLIARSNGPPKAGGLAAASALAVIDNERAAQAATHWQRRFDGYEDAEGSLVEIYGTVRRVWTADEMERQNARTLVAECVKRLREDYGPFLETWKP